MQREFSDDFFAGVLRANVVFEIQQHEPKFSRKRLIMVYTFYHLNYVHNLPLANQSRLLSSVALICFCSLVA